MKTASQFYGLLFIPLESRRLSNGVYSIRLLDKSLKGVEIFFETHEHDIIMGGGWNDEKFLFLCPEVVIEILGVLERDKRILFPMDDQGGKEYLLNALQTCLIDLFETHSMGRHSKMDHDPHHARKATFQDEPFKCLLMVMGQFQGRDAPQRPSHDPEVRSKISFGELDSDLFKDGMGILNKVSEGWDPVASTITSVVGDD
jgi:hypothetical protein